MRSRGPRVEVVPPREKSIVEGLAIVGEVFTLPRGDNMTAVIESARIPVDVHHLWEELGHFGEVVWHPLLARVESIGNQPGALRHVETRDGMRQVERLDEIDPSHHCYRYTLQSSALPVENYRGELRLEELGPASSLVTWSARFDVTRGDELTEAESIRRFLRAGLDGLQARYS